MGEGTNIELGIDQVDVAKDMAIPTAIPEFKDKNLGYTDKQTEYIKAHYGLEVKKGNILVTRAQVDTQLPTALRSCCVITPEQNSFYLGQGFIFDLPAEQIPWVSDRDAGSPMTTNRIPKPQNALDVNEFLSKTQHVGKYNETVINFGEGLGNEVKAIFDFREVPQEPSPKQRILQPQKSRQIASDIEYIVSTRKEWAEKAKELNVPLLTNLPDQSIVENLRQEDKIGRQKFDKSAL